MIPNGYKSVLQLSEDVHDDDICTYSVASVGVTGSISNLIFDFSTNITVPSTCRKVFVAPFAAVSG